MTLETIAGVARRFVAFNEVQLRNGAVTACVNLEPSFPGEVARTIATNANAFLAPHGIRWEWEVDQHGVRGRLVAAPEKGKRK